ncbi:MAG: HypC/HybG/HupF family hydrogenase formation chaperone [Hyphomicrobiaceae bacterium]|nr:HypC/HybG/HupF family hydrogenase formation chaperone [Hyphomicrobiaceae bacterium]
MCIGIPMQVLKSDGLSSRCSARDGVHDIDTSLVGPVQPGQWLMVFLGAAREIISDETARVTSDALAALELAMRGETDIDHLFADLVDREPELPDHLRINQKTA